MAATTWSTAVPATTPSAGGAGADDVIGGTGNDHLWGGTNADDFIFDDNWGWGNDWIWDFQAGSDNDRPVGRRRLEQHQPARRREHQQRRALQLQRAVDPAGWGLVLLSGLDHGFHPLTREKDGQSGARDMDSRRAPAASAGPTACRRGSCHAIRHHRCSLSSVIGRSRTRLPVAW